MGRKGTWVALLLVGCLALTGVGSTPARADAAGDTAQPPAPTRVLLLGDSITHGSAGDWTWRYRLWRHLQRVGAPVDLVGPDRTLREGSTAYADPDFDTDHAARWGNRLVMPMLPPAALAREHRPDVVVVLLGYNDLVFFHLTPPRVAELMAGTIATVRAAAPGVDVVLAEVPLATATGVPRLNAAYAELATALDTPEERVVLADTDAGFVRSTETDVHDTYDPAHPTARGELKIAAAVADALARLGVGAPHARPLPVLPLGPRSSGRLTAEAGDGSATLRWGSVEGVTGHVVWSRRPRQEWTRVSDVLATRSLVVGDLVNGRRHEFRLQPVKGWARSSDVRSATVVVTPRAPAPARPRGLSARRDRAGLAVAWSAVSRASGYRVRFRVAGAARWHGRTTVRTSLRLTGLRAGTRYQVRVRAVDHGTAGAWSRRVRATTRR